MARVRLEAGMVFVPATEKRSITRSSHRRIIATHTRIDTEEVGGDRTTVVYCVGGDRNRACSKKAFLAWRRRTNARLRA